MIPGQATDQHTSLIVGFDAVGIFLRARWKEGEKQSDDLANLLGSMNRDVGRNSQPLDIAQWSDWLDAVLLVRPDLDEVRQARLQMQDDHQKLRRILETAPSEQPEKLNQYRTETASQTWHRVGDCSMSILDGYEAMRAFVAAYWHRGRKQSREIGIILENLLHEEPAAAGLAQWDNWLAVRTAQREAR